jgi:transposase
MKQSRKIYDRAFKEKVVQLSYERHNISELAQLGITAPQLYNGVKSTKSLDKEVFQVMVKQQT